MTRTSRTIGADTTGSQIIKAMFQKAIQAGSSVGLRNRKPEALNEEIQTVSND